MDQRVQTLVEAFRATVDEVSLLAVFIVILAFLLIVFALVFWEKVEEFISQRYLKRLFFKNGKEYGLTREELEILWRYSHKLHKSPFLAIEYKSPFEKVVQAYIDDNPDTFNEKLIKSMRKKLGFDKIPSFIPLISTKDIDLFQTGNLIWNKRNYPVALYDKDERFMYWYLIDAQPPFPFKKGDIVKIRFIREDDAIYVVEGKIEDIFEENGKYIVKIPHTFRLIQIQRRRDFRLKEHLPLDVVAPDINSNQVKIHTQTADISIDGIGFCIPVLEARKLKVKIGDKLPVSIEFEEEGKKINAVVAVKNIREVGKNICYGAEFEEISDEDKNFLIKFIQLKQQEMLKAYKRLKTFD